MVLCNEYDPKHPQFHSSVTKVPLPAGFKLPRIERYDGTSDPDDHLRNFYVHMMLYGNQSSQQFPNASDAIFCRAFPCTLTGPALRWFFTVTPGSIVSFSQLTKKFLKRFESSKTCTNLCLKQGDDESLKDYIARSKLEANKVDDISGRDYMRLVEVGLKPGSFKESLVKNPPLNLKNLWRSAAQFVHEDDNKHCNKRQRDSGSQE